MSVSEISEAEEDRFHSTDRSPSITRPMSPWSSFKRKFHNSYFGDPGPWSLRSDFAAPPQQYIGRSHFFLDDPKRYKCFKPEPEPTHPWANFVFSSAEIELLKELTKEDNPPDPLSDRFTVPEIAIIRAAEPDYDPPPVTTIELLSMKMRRRNAARKQPDVVPFYFYLGHEVGAHMPRRVNFRMFDEEFVYSECPDLRAVLDDRKFPIEFWHEDGTFRRLDPKKALNCRFRRRLMIFRPGRQPKNYLTYCVGFRELSYELFLSNMQVPCVPIQDGIAPAASKEALAMDHTWELHDANVPFQDVIFARGDDGPWETGSGYESDTPQEEEPCPLLIRTKGSPDCYNKILRHCPRFGLYVDKIEEQQGPDGSVSAYALFETVFDMEWQPDFLYCQYPPMTL